MGSTICFSSDFVAGTQLWVPEYEIYYPSMQSFLHVFPILRSHSVRGGFITSTIQPLGHVHFPRREYVPDS